MNEGGGGNVPLLDIEDYTQFDGFDVHSGGAMGGAQLMHDTVSGYGGNRQQHKKQPAAGGNRSEGLYAYPPSCHAPRNHGRNGYAAP